MTDTATKPSTAIALRRRLLRRAVPALALAAMTALAACAQAPATGRTIFTGGLSQEKEEEIGQQQYRQIKKGEAFGGPYEENAELTSYVASIGRLLAKTSEMPDIKWTFTVLDTPIVNAFATPGGYIYVTRGLVALAENEAELAGVLAHEIGHVTARHMAERYGQSVIAQVLNLGAAVALGGGMETQAIGALSAVMLRSYSREQEFEADTLGVRYLTRAGYEPEAMASFLAKLQEHSRLEAKMRGQPGAADKFNIMQTHPRTADRVEAAIQAAAGRRVTDPIVARDIYLDKIDGMIYGDSPEQGMVRGREFLHPDLRFAFEVPRGFHVVNGEQQVVAFGPDDALIVFDSVKVDRGISMRDFLTRQWAKDVRLSRVERINVNGMEAATGETRLNTRDGARDLRLVAYRYGGQRVYRFMFVTEPGQTASFNEAFRRTTYSFRRLSDEEALAIKPYRLDVQRVQRGETLSGIARAMPYDDFQLERLAVLNGLDKNDNLVAGQRIKTVIVGN
ncbi:MAG: M48 family metalloprotease [Rhodovibrionaceae bacterium]|nr:M48 family metalloprotease [Rhodovibrionaceae bacterium]